MKIIQQNDPNVGLPQPAIRRMLITGANGTLGRAFQRICAMRGIEVIALSRAELNISDPVSVESVLSRYNPWAVVNTAGYVQVDEAEKDFERCYRENTIGPAILAAACAYRDTHFLTFSSDMVFDGSKSVAYVESDMPCPLNIYGNSKRLAEREVLACMPKALVVRTSAFFSAWDDYNFVYHTLRAGHNKQAFEAADDVLVSPTYVPDLVNTSLDLLIDEECGVWHLANQGAYTWADLAKLAADMASLDTSFIIPRSMRALGLPAARPIYSVLGSTQGVLLPSSEERLHGCVSEVITVMRNASEELMAVAS